MTVSALTRPGERDRLIVKFGEIDWIFCLAITLIAGAGAVMLFSIAGSSWMPWAAPHLARFALFFAIMIVLSLIDLRVWFALAYPVGLGMGDVKLALLLGAALGYAVVGALLLGTLAAGLVAAVMLFKEGSSARKRAIPLGPFLAGGAIVVLLFL